MESLLETKLDVVADRISPILKAFLTKIDSMILTRPDALLPCLKGGNLGSFSSSGCPMVYRNSASKMLCVLCQHDPSFILGRI